MPLNSIDNSAETSKPSIEGFDYQYLGSIFILFSQDDPFKKISSITMEYVEDLISFGENDLNEIHYIQFKDWRIINIGNILNEMKKRYYDIYKKNMESHGHRIQYSFFTSTVKENLGKEFLDLKQIIEFIKKFPSFSLDHYFSNPQMVELNIKKIKAKFVNKIHKSFDDDRFFIDFLKTINIFNEKSENEMELKIKYAIGKLFNYKESRINRIYDHIWNVFRKSVKGDLLINPSRIIHFKTLIFELKELENGGETKISQQEFEYAKDIMNKLTPLLESTISSLNHLDEYIKTNDVQECVITIGDKYTTKRDVHNVESIVSLCQEVTSSLVPSLTYNSEEMIRRYKRLIRKR